ncbi:MAG: hypothetical protein IPI54_17635 [Chitinophagaceae bacterium]|nr:hypothetical protein [Chitinophagaceae bacterium]
MRNNLRVTLLLAVTVVVACKTEARPRLGQSVTRGWFTGLRSSNGADVALLEDGDLQTSIPAAEMGALELRWDTSVRALALAVHSPSAAVVEVGGNKEPVELEQGWNILPIAERAHATTLKWVQDSPLSEVQLVEGSRAPWMDAEVLLGAGVQDPGTRVVTPSPDHGSLDPGQASCRTFEFQVPIPPSGLQRAVVGLDVTHAWGVFSLGRALNDAPMMEALGTALEADGQRRAVTAELPVQQLKRGGNVLRLCADGWSRHSIQLEHVRVALELARGSVQSPFPKEPARLVLDGRQDSTTVLPVQVELRETVMVGAVEVIHHGAASGLRVMRGTQEVPVARREEIEGGTALFLARSQNTWAGALTVAGEGAVAEVRVLGLPMGPGLLGRPRVDFPLAGQLVGPYAVVTGTLPVAGANGLVTLTGAGMANGSGVLREGWFAVSALRTTLDNGSYPAELTVTTDQGEEWVIALDFTADLTRTVGAGGRATTSLPVDEERDRFGLVGGPPARGTVTAEAGGSIKLGSDVVVRFPKGAVAEATEVSIQRMSELAIHPLNPGMINVTAPGGALYRFEPSPRQFQEKVTVTLPYDPNLVPPNVPSSEIRTYYFDLAEQKYVPLETLDVDESRSVVLALTDHFTDMINAVLMQPESPTPQSFNPNAISGLAAADPTTGMTLVAPPEVRADGSAGITYPFPLPKARGRFQPQLALTYNSQGGMGQAGWGWSLTTSSIEVDTRYGAPEYAAPGVAGRGERYTWDGQQLVPTETTLACSNGENGRQFRLRREGRFARIVRCGDGPTTYSWEVTEKDGTRFVYGRHSNARLADVRPLGTNGGPNIARWMLEAVEDSDGNQTEFHYRRGTQAIGLESDLFPSPLAQFLELASIRYGGNVRGLPPTYHVDLDYGTRAPKSDGGVFLEPHVFDNSVESALGFAVMRFERLERVVISSQAAGSTPVATYVLRYSVPQAESLFRSLLVGVDSYDALGPDGAAHDSADGGMTPGGDVHRTTFEYFTAPTQDGGTATESSSAFVMGGSGTQETWQLDETDHMPLTGSYTANGFLRGVSMLVLGSSLQTIWAAPVAAPASLTAGKTTPVVSMLDVNGDGLADRVVSRLGPVRRRCQAGRGWLRLTSLAPPDTDVVGTVVFLNNGHGFERLAPSRLHNFPRLGRDLQLGMSAGVGFNVGVDLASVAGNLGFQGGAQVTTDTMLDFNGDGLVDGLSARPVVQSQQGGVIRFDDGLSGPGAGCLGLDPSQEPAEVDPDEPTSAPQDTPWTSCATPRGSRAA